MVEDCKIPGQARASEDSIFNCVVNDSLTFQFDGRLLIERLGGIQVVTRIPALDQARRSMRLERDNISNFTSTRPS